MLDRLAIELLRHIFALLPSSPAPTAVDLALDQPRLGALRACCLASKALRDIAQEELWSVVRISHLAGRRAVQEGIEMGTARKTWAAVVKPNRGHELPPTDVVRALQTLAGLEELHLYYWDPPRILDSLRRLVLEGLDLLSFLPQLSSLEELSLFHMSIPRSSLLQALHPTTTPALRAVAVSGLVDTESRGEMIPDLRAVHLARLEGFQSVLLALSKYAANRPRRLRTLFLPIFLHPSRPVPAAIEPLRDTLFKVCKENAVDVHWRYPGALEPANALEPGWRKVARWIKAEAQEAGGT
ncbi:hypothetical protein JCM10213_000708 [Rhodosporidiobolus nylandii]